MYTILGDLPLSKKKTSDSHSALEDLTVKLKTRTDELQKYNPKSQFHTSLVKQLMLEKIFHVNLRH